jgi:transaldolase
MQVSHTEDVGVVRKNREFLGMKSVQANTVLELHGQGQSVWLDYIRRDLIASGGLNRLVAEDGLRGVTSNPSIFERAIDESTDYDEALRELLVANPNRGARVLYDELSIEDVRNAADILRPAYDESASADGFVSIEPPPQLTQDTARTIAEARRLWRAINRPNLMIKVVATSEGIAAVEALISEGINVNITLMFSLRHYEAVANAYLRGLERCREPGKVGSVASFFVSRVDTEADRALEAIGTADALALRGKVAIANAKMAYRRFREIFHGEPFRTLRRRGAHVQRPLWASTSTKNPNYRDVMYIEELIGPDTVNTIPPVTLDAFRDHGHVRGATVAEGWTEASDVLSRLTRLTIDLGAITERLQTEGIATFATAYDRVLAAVDKKRYALLAEVARMTR